MSRLTLTLITLSLALAVAGCDKKQLNAVPDAQPQNLPDSPTATAQESTAEEQNAQPQDSTDSPMSPDKESTPKESQIADDTPVDPANRKPFQFTITTDNTNSPVVIQFGETHVYLEITKSGGLKEIKRAVVIHPNKSKIDALVEIDCESDGAYEFIGNTIKHECNYPRNSGTHQISIRGDISAIELGAIRLHHDNCNTKECSNIKKIPDTFLSYLNPIISVDSWGDIQWESMENFAYNCRYLEKIPEDAPNLRHVSSLSGMFRDATKFNQALDHWNVSNVTNMSEMFEGAESFNQPLEKWNVSNVTNMSWMFVGATSFNQPLENWDVSNVTNMAHMFYYTQSFNQPLEKWNVSNVTNMNSMFMGAKSFNQPLNQWDISSVNDMGEMFSEAVSFNHYPSSWIVPKHKTDFMFSGSPLEEQAKQKPLKTRKVKK